MGRLPVRETLAFVTSVIGDEARRILEIGAGDGELAAELMRRDHEVVAIDPAFDAVAAARERGVDARLAVWPKFEDGIFDAILFTRSLHHIEHPDPALEKAAAAVRPGGCVLVEDFAFPDIGPATIQWFVSRLRKLERAGRLAHDPGSFAWRLLDAAEPLETWEKAADHVHGARTLRRALRGHFTQSDEEAVPYFYRYLADLAREEDLESFFGVEHASIEAGEIEALGLRLVGFRSPSR